MPERVLKVRIAVSKPVRRFFECPSCDRQGCMLRCGEKAFNNPEVIGNYDESMSRGFW